MDCPPYIQQEFRYQRVELFKAETLGVGSYGAVCKARCDELPCAAKILHPVMFQFNDPGAMAFLGKFEQECQFLRTIKHPNIVQYIATSRDRETGLPVLLMELMDESLTSFLERSQQPLPYHTQVDLCHDIALALAYLHSNRMVHRDLSSNNVLLIAGSRAKVTDFGMSKLIDTNPRMTPLTKCPGTLVYMSPEALGDPPVYTEKLDCFSEGVLTIQIITRQFPNPGPAMRMIEDPRYPLGRVQVLVPEAERRRSHIVLIDSAHPLLPLALRCLEYNEEDRPSSQELCHCLATLKGFPAYIQSVQQAQERGTQADTEERERQIRELKQQMWEKDRQLRAKDTVLAASKRAIHQHQQELQQIRQQLQEKDKAIKARVQTLQQQVQVRDQQPVTKDQQLRAKYTEINERERENLQLRQELQHTTHQLQEKNRMIKSQARQTAERERENCQLQEELQHTTHQLREKNRVIEARERQLRELNQQLQTNEQVTAEFQRNLLRKEREVRDLEEGLSKQEASGGRTTQLQWKRSAIQYGMAYTQPAVDGKIVYFRSRNVVAYDSEAEKLSVLPVCPHAEFPPAVVSGLLTAIGGKDWSGSPTNKLLSLTGKGRERKWVERFPPMPTKRYYATVLCTGRHLIVAGGETDVNTKTDKVEVMNVDTQQWTTASSLPHPVHQATATLCGDDVYLLGGYDQNGKGLRSVFRCSLNVLLQSNDSHKVWQRVADLPVTLSTCATLQGRLITVGGTNLSRKNTSAVHEYNPATNSWKVISHTPTPCWGCAVAVLPGNRLMAVDGSTVHIGALQ